MSDLTFDFDLLFKLVLYVLLPLVALIIISRVIISLCTKKIRQEDPEKYYHIINCWLSCVAIIVTLVLVIITVVYASYFVTKMKEKGLVETHKIIYYLVFAFPVVPFVFLIYYIIGLVKMRKLSKEESENQNATYQNLTREYPTHEENNFSGFSTSDISLTNFNDSTLDDKTSKQDSDDENKEEKSGIELL